MLIELTLGGALVEFLPANGEGNSARLEIADGGSVADALGTLGIPLDARMMVIADGTVVPRDEFVTTRLQPDAKLAVIPPIQAG